MEKVSIGFGGPPLLEHVNFQIERDERIWPLTSTDVTVTMIFKNPEHKIIYWRPMS